MEVAPFFVDFHHFLSIFTIFYRFSRFTHFCRNLHFVAIYALFSQFFFGQNSLLRNITRFLHVWRCAFSCGASPKNWSPIPLQGPAVGRGMAELLLDGSFSSLDLSALSFDRWPLSGRWTDDQAYSWPVGQNIFEGLRDECFCQRNCLNNNKQNKLTSNFNPSQNS